MRNGVLFIWCSYAVVCAVAGCGNGSDDEHGSSGSLDGEDGEEERPTVCRDDNDCAGEDMCRIGTCDAATRICTFERLDGDGDGFPPRVCGGTDCDDANFEVNQDAPEILGNDRDDNCNGIVDETGGDGVETVDPTCRVNESCNVLFCGSWRWRYMDVAYEEGMGMASWIPQLRQILLQDRVRDMRQDGCTLEIPPVDNAERHVASITPAPRGFRYEETAWHGDSNANVYCEGEYKQDIGQITAECGGRHVYFTTGAIPYTARLTLHRQ